MKCAEESDHFSSQNILHVENPPSITTVEILKDSFRAKLGPSFTIGNVEIQPRTKICVPDKDLFDLALKLGSIDVSGQQCATKAPPKISSLEKFDPLLFSALNSTFGISDGGSSSFPSESPSVQNAQQPATVLPTSKSSPLMSHPPPPYSTHFSPISKQLLNLFLDNFSQQISEKNVKVEILKESDFWKVVLSGKEENVEKILMALCGCCDEYLPVTHMVAAFFHFYLPAKTFLEQITTKSQKLVSFAITKNRAVCAQDTDLISQSKSLIGPFSYQEDSDENDDHFALHIFGQDELVSETKQKILNYLDHFLFLDTPALSYLFGARTEEFAALYKPYAKFASYQPKEVFSHFEEIEASHIRSLKSKIKSDLLFGCECKFVEVDFSKFPDMSLAAEAINTCLSSPEWEHLCGNCFPDFSLLESSPNQCLYGSAAEGFAETWREISGQLKIKAIRLFGEPTAVSQASSLLQSALDSLENAHCLEIPVEGFRAIFLKQMGSEFMSLTCDKVGVKFEWKADSVKLSGERSAVLECQEAIKQQLSSICQATIVIDGLQGTGLLPIARKILETKMEGQPIIIMPYVGIPDCGLGLIAGSPGILQYAQIEIESFCVLSQTFRLTASQNKFFHRLLAENNCTNLAQKWGVGVSMQEGVGNGQVVISAWSQENIQKLWQACVAMSAQK